MKFNFLPLKKITPKGWIRKQLLAQANGLNGNLDKVWKDVRDSKWIGGDGEGWERFPYFLDGYMPLAYLLSDDDKIERANRYADALISSQRENGCFLPKKDDSQNADIWSQFLILKVLSQYGEITGDERAEKAVYDGLKYLSERTREKTPDNWACSRWYECIIPALWIYGKRKEDWIIRFARRLKTYGLNYGEALKLWDKVDEKWNYETHVVNVAMALKSDALFSEITGEKMDGLAGDMLEMLDKYHGTAYGHFNGDECLSGNEPIRGSELCSVVEAMYSYEWLMAITGEKKWGDRLERLAYNGLPATVSTDMWTHQYDQQVNQIACTPFKVKPFITNNNEANLFGLEPHYGCCTSNFGQGFPKLCASAFMEKEGRLVVLSPLPMEVTVGEIRVECKSEYPFRSSFSLVASDEIEVLVRIPFSAKPSCSVPFKEENGYMALTLRKGESARITFPFEPTLVDRPQGRKCVCYGPLLFALPVASRSVMKEYERNGVERKFPYCDYEFLPVGEWRYAFASDKFKVIECDYDLPFDREKPAIKLEGEFAPVEWDYQEGMDLVASVVAGKKRRGKNEKLLMNPYGATYLRIAEMAKVDE